MIFKLDKETFEIRNEGLDLSIPLRFNDVQPNAYGVKRAASKPCKAGDLVGDTRLGGSCNFEEYSLITHCNGTHTECVGHITHDRKSVRDCLTDILMPSTLISVEPEDSRVMDDTYPSGLNKGDMLITRKSLSSSNLASEISESSALIVRTLPNDEAKLTSKYSENFIPPFFSYEAIKQIEDFGIKHLLVDLPSIDRIFDGGNLLNHRSFWGIEPGSFEVNENTSENKTITELIYVPNEIEDGRYLLNLQIAPFEADASPSRPVIFKYETED